MKICCKLRGIVAFAGLTKMLWRVAVATVNDVLPDTEPNVAVIVVTPAVLPVVANPGWAGVRKSATALFKELQVTCTVISFDDLSK